MIVKQCAKCGKRKFDNKIMVAGEPCRSCGGKMEVVATVREAQKKFVVNHEHLNHDRELE